MKRLILASSDDLVDVSEYNSMMEELYDYILDNAPIDPSSQQLWGKGMNYASSTQKQIYTLTFRWDPDVVDGGFELRVSVNPFNISKAINNPPNVDSKIMTFLNSKTASEFRSASDTLLDLFKFADSIRRYAKTIF